MTLEEEPWYVKSGIKAIFTACLPSKDTITYRIESLEPLRVAEVTSPLGKALGSYKITRIRTYFDLKESRRALWLTIHQRDSLLNGL